MDEEKRVAAYCRVSTNEELQKTSIETQGSAFEDLITKHPGWILTGIYGDRGKTGLNMNRPGFQQMLADARAGKIDIIMMKSVSRASRNTVDLLKFAREMSSLGVDVYFCKENVHTKTLGSEFLLTAFAAYAQEESRSISENNKRGVRQRFELGIAKWCPLYGFKRVKKGVWTIDEETAPVVRKIFDLCIKGYSNSEIAEMITKDGVKTESGQSVWNQCQIAKLIHNEKFMGDFLTQKSYVVDFMTGKQVPNNKGVLPQKLIKNNHEGIVSEETFRLANDVMAMQSLVHGTYQYPYYRILRCPYCGGRMVHVYRPAHTNQHCWICEGSGENVLQKDRTDCPMFMARQYYIDKYVTEAIDELPDDTPEVAWCRELMKERGKIDYVVIYKLIEKITYPDRWHLKITWKNGGETVKEIQYDRVMDIPLYGQSEELVKDEEEHGFKLFSGEFAMAAGKLREYEAVMGMVEIKPVKGTDVPGVTRPHKRYPKKNKKGSEKK